MHTPKLVQDLTVFVNKVLLEYSHFIYIFYILSLTTWEP